jgi:N-acylneuraminate cytidylyltransferase
MDAGKTIAIIPARGGSKRVPRKNIKDFCGKPMLSWSVEAAVESGRFDHILVSTDDDEIAAVAEQAGASVPFRRPNHLSDDFAATRPVVNHAIESAQTLYGAIANVCCIYPTAPFLTSDAIRASGDLLREKRMDFVFSCTTFAYPIQRALRIIEGGGVEMMWPEHRTTRSQDLEEAYHDAGQFYWGRAEAFLRGQNVFGDGSAPWVLPRYIVHDIDTPEDWLRAELAFQVLRSNRDHISM